MCYNYLPISNWLTDMIENVKEKKKNRKVNFRAWWFLFSSDVSPKQFWWHWLCDKNRITCLCFCGCGVSPLLNPGPCCFFVLSSRELLYLAPPHSLLWKWEAFKVKTRLLICANIDGTKAKTNVECTSVRKTIRRIKGWKPEEYVEQMGKRKEH